MIIWKIFEIESNDLQEELELLKELKPHAIITTNYDQLMEEIFPKYQPIIGQEVIYKKSSTDIGHILKIHGSVDYTDFYERQIYLIAKLFTYFVEHPIIFLGYSISDRNVQSILYNAKKLLMLIKNPSLKIYGLSIGTPVQSPVILCHLRKNQSL